MSKEDKLFVPNGQIIEVNGHYMHIYMEGEGDIEKRNSTHKSISEDEFKKET